MNAKTTGRLAAMFAVTIVVALILWSEIAAPPEAGIGADQEIPDLPVTQNDEPTGSLDAPDGIHDIVTMGTQGVWTNADPEVGLVQIRWDTLDPKANGLFDITGPDASVTLDDRRIVISADTGELIWPARGMQQDREPESGTLRGNVRLAMYAGATAVDGETPVVVLTTEALSFDTTLGEAKAPGPLRVESDRIVYRGTGLALRYSESPWRLTTLRVDSDNSILIRDGASGGATERASEGESAPRQPDASSQEDFYRVTLREDVRLRSSIAEMEAEQFLIVARLLDGELPEGAIAEFRSTLASASAISPGTGSQSTTTNTGSVHLDWAGPLEVRPARERPDQLANDDLHLTVRSPASNLVSLTDLGSGGTLRCVSMEYGATTRRLSLLGLGGIGVRALLPGAGEAIFGRLDLDLTSGEGSIPGPIRLVSDDRAARDRGEPQLELSALDGATFRLATDYGPVGAGGIVDPVEVILSGRVEGTDGVRTITGDSARALFTRRTESRPDADPALARMIVTGNARASENGTGDFIAADALDLSLDPFAPSGQLVPTAAAARGNALASQGGRSVRAGIIESTFVRDASGEIALDDVVAQDSVRITSQDGIRVGADRVTANESTGAVDLTGSPIRVASTQDDVERTFTASSARYDRNASTLTVFGAGTGTQRSLGTPDSGFTTVETSWNETMVYDEVAGVVELQGGVQMIAENPGVERHTARAHLVTINLAPETTSGSRFLGATLDALDEETPATVELKRFLPGAPDSTQSLANMRGGRIELDAIASTIDVVGPGLLLVDDRSPSERGESENDGDAFAFGVRGSTLFEWTESLRFDRPQGLSTMRGRVRVLHRNAKADEVTQLECEKLAALISEPPTSAEGQPRLVRVDATDAVYAKHGPVELVSDEMVYLAFSSTLEARSSAGNLVTVRDDREGRHISAEAVSLDVETGDWTIIDASPVTSPE